MAMTPTLNIPSKMAPKSSILNILVTRNHIKTKVISPMNIFLAPVPRVHT